MDRFLTLLGGMAGGYALMWVPGADTVIAGLGSILDLIGAASIIVFACAFIVYGVRSLLSK